MKLINLNTIGKNLATVVILAVLPALAILLYTGMEQRRESIEQAKRNVLVLTHSMAQVQEDISRSFRQLLSTLSLLPEIQTMDPVASQSILSAVLADNPDYHNLLLVNLEGNVIAAGRAFNNTNLSDRKHISRALTTRDFATGEFIITRVGPKSQVFPFAYPVFDQDGQPKGVLTGAVNLNLFARFHALGTLPENGFIALTDNQGIRLLYYPEKESNPIGKQIKKGAWEIARASKEPGIIFHEGSDGKRMLLSFEQIRLQPDSEPYIYVWTGLPESHILQPANAALTRNLSLMLLATLMAFFIAWIIGRRTIISPINKLLGLTQKFTSGQFDARSDLSNQQSEFGTLTTAFHDMATALASSQKTLLENEARFRLIMDSLDAVVYVADMDNYEILFINEYARKAFGEVTGQSCWKALQKDQNGPCPFCTNRYLLDDNGHPAGIYRWESQNTANDRWYFIQDRAITWTDGRIVRLEIATDITDRRLAAARLAEESERLAVTLRSIGDGVITTDTAGNIVLINPVGEQLTGWTQAQAAGKQLLQVFNIETARNQQATDWEPLNENNRYPTARAVLVDKQGQRKTIANSNARILDSAGKTIGTVLVFRDISAQLRTEQELSKIQKLESIGVLAGGIAHDFNNILAAILGSLDLSLRDNTLSEKTQRLLNQALNASYRARDLTLQLLTFAKGGEPIKQSASLAEVVIDSADFVLRGDKVACHYHFPDDLQRVDIDKGQISQVVQNMVINAGHAMPDGGTIDIIASNASATEINSLALPNNGRFVKLTISDPGVGIPAELQEKIFDPYFTTKKQGSGLGLAICHSIINKHNGTISVDSTPGEGTRFTIYLPASKDNSVPPEQQEAELPRSRKARIMVLDDEEIIRTIASAMLIEMGHEVLLANEGQQAIEIYQENLRSKHPIDLIIMDLTIPGGMGGQEALRQILAIDPRAMAVVSSGYSNDPVMANFADYGFVGAIGKPYQFTAMAKTVNHLLS